MVQKNSILTKLAICLTLPCLIATTEIAFGVEDINLLPGVVYSSSVSEGYTQGYIFNDTRLIIDENPGTFIEDPTDLTDLDNNGISSGNSLLLQGAGRTGNNFDSIGVVFDSNALTLGATVPGVIPVTLTNTDVTLANNITLTGEYNTDPLAVFNDVVGRNTTLYADRAFSALGPIDLANQAVTLVAAAPNTPILYNQTNFANVSNAVFMVSKSIVVQNPSVFNFSQVSLADSQILKFNYTGNTDITENINNTDSTPNVSALILQGANSQFNFENSVAQNVTFNLTNNLDPTVANQGIINLQNIDPAGTLTLAGPGVIGSINKLNSISIIPFNGVINLSAASIVNNLIFGNSGNGSRNLLGDVNISASNTYNNVSFNQDVVGQINISTTTTWGPGAISFNNQVSNIILSGGNLNISGTVSGDDGNATFVLNNNTIRYSQQNGNVINANFKQGIGNGVVQFFSSPINSTMTVQNPSIGNVNIYIAGITNVIIDIPSGAETVFNKNLAFGAANIADDTLTINTPVTVSGTITNPEDGIFTVNSILTMSTPQDWQVAQYNLGPPISGVNSRVIFKTAGQYITLDSGSHILNWGINCTNAGPAQGEIEFAANAPGVNLITLPVVPGNAKIIVTKNSKSTGINIGYVAETDIDDSTTFTVDAAGTDIIAAAASPGYKFIGPTSQLLITNSIASDNTIGIQAPIAPEIPGYGIVTVNETNGKTLTLENSSPGTFGGLGKELSKVNINSIGTVNVSAIPIFADNVMLSGGSGTSTITLGAVNTETLTCENDIPNLQATQTIAATTAIDFGSSAVVLTVSNNANLTTPNVNNGNRSKITYLGNSVFPGKFNGLGELELGAGNVTFTELNTTQNINTINSNGNNSWTLAPNTTITGNIDNPIGAPGELTIECDGTTIINGKVGQSNPVGDIIIGETFTGGELIFIDTVNANSISVTNKNDVTFGANVSTTEDPGITVDNGKMSVTSSVTISGGSTRLIDSTASVGTNTVTFNSDVYFSGNTILSPGMNSTGTTQGKFATGGAGVIMDFTGVTSLDIEMDTPIGAVVNPKGYAFLDISAGGTIVPPLPSSRDALRLSRAIRDNAILLAKNNTPISPDDTLITTERIRQEATEENMDAQQITTAETEDNSAKVEETMLSIKDASSRNAFTWGSVNVKDKNPDVTWKIDSSGNLVPTSITPPPTPTPVVPPSIFTEITQQPENISGLSTSVTSNVLYTIIASTAQSVTSSVVNCRINDMCDSEANPCGASGGDCAIQPTGSVWVSPIIGVGKQRIYKDAGSYKIDTVGGTIGVDKFIDDTSLVGIALGYVDNKVKYTGINKGDSARIKTTLLTAYYRGEIEKKHFVQLMANIADNRILSTHLRSSVISGKTKGLSYGFEGQVGHNIVSGYNVFTPIVGLRYTHSKVNAYTETGNSLYNLNYGRQRYNITEALAGVRYRTSMCHENMVFTPEAHAFIYQGLGKTKLRPVVRLVGATSDFPTDTHILPSTSYNIGFGGTGFFNNITEAGLYYDANFGKKYIGHQISAKFRFLF